MDDDSRLFDRYVRQDLRPLTERDYSEFAALLMPRVKSLARGHAVDALDRDGLVNQALCVILQRLAVRSFPLSSLLAFEPYMTRSIQNALKNAFRDQLGGAGPDPVEIPPQHSVQGDLDPTAPELDRVHVALVDRAYKRNRFGELTPAIFRYIASSLLGGKPISSHLLARFGVAVVSTARFVSHVDLLLRLAMYDLKEAIERDGAF